MKKNIHPVSSLKKVECACGHSFEEMTTYSKSDKLKIGVCNHCHPFYTGKHRIIDETGRIEKFRQKYSKAVKEQAKSK